jgi:ABC-type nitrate/sulfonate/bicarbonate transport system substrate-binding protein
MDLVENELKLKFEKYDDGSGLSKDTVYFVDTISNYSHAINNAKILDGGIIWEPQYQYILTSDLFTDMVSTNILYPGHTCCLIAGDEKFIQKHSDVAIRFLAGFIKSTNYINEAKQDPSGEDFAKLVQICKDNMKDSPRTS